MTEEMEGQEREEVNAMMGTFASADDSIYMISSDIIYRLDMEKKELVVNCGNFLCGHDSITCSARIPHKSSFYEVKRNGDHVYVLGDKIYEISKDSKKEVGQGGYGNYGNKILFGDYIAYFEKEDAVVVKHIESDKEIQRFEGIRGYVQGSFYHMGCLYYVTDTNQLARLEIETGNMDILEKKGATRASVYEGSIYYIKVSEETDTNWLIKMNPETLEKQELAEGVFYYNILGETLYYISYPEQEFYSVDLNGENQEKIPVREESDFGWLWAFPKMQTILLMEDPYTFYFFDSNIGEIDYDKPLICPESEGEVIPDGLLE